MQPCVPCVAVAPPCATVVHNTCRTQSPAGVKPPATMSVTCGPACGMDGTGACSRCLASGPLPKPRSATTQANTNAEIDTCPPRGQAIAGQASGLPLVRLTRTYDSPKRSLTRNIMSETVVIWCVGDLVHSALYFDWEGGGIGTIGRGRARVQGLWEGGDVPLKIILWRSAFRRAEPALTWGCRPSPFMSHFDNSLGSGAHRNDEFVCSPN